MARGKLRKIVVVAAIAATIAMVVKKLRGEPAPQFSNHPTVKGGPTVDPVRQPTPAARPAPRDPTVPAPASTTLVAAPEDPTVPDDDAPAASNAAGEQTWVAPVDGTCPDGYPVKAKVKSGIFHQPGGLAYERTNPDRCYQSADAAEADGLRAAKR